MKNKKLISKLLLIFLTFLMINSLIGCSKSNDEDNTEVLGVAYDDSIVSNVKDIAVGYWKLESNEKIVILSLIRQEQYLDDPDYLHGMFYFMSYENDTYNVIDSPCLYDDENIWYDNETDISFTINNDTMSLKIDDNSYELTKTNETSFNEIKEEYEQIESEQIDSIESSKDTETIDSTETN
jgi:hypothetical protein